MNSVEEARSGSAAGRRRLLARLAALAGVALASSAVARGVRAEEGDQGSEEAETPVILGGSATENDAEDMTTYLSSSSSDQGTLHVAHESDGTAVTGASSSGIGVLGTGAVGLQGQSSSRALNVIGRNYFTQAGRSGGATSGGQTVPVIRAGQVSVRVTGVDVSETAAILVTLMGDPGRGIALKHVRRVGPNAFRVFLTGRAQIDTPFAYFILG